MENATGFKEFFLFFEKYIILIKEICICNMRLANNYKRVGLVDFPKKGVFFLKILQNKKKELLDFNIKEKKKN